FTIPRDVICACPSVPASHVLAVLDRNGRRDIVVQTAGRPAMMRLARCVVICRFAKQENVWPTYTAANYERMSAAVGFAPLHEILLAVDVKAISTAAC